MQFNHNYSLPKFIQMQKQPFILCAKLFFKSIHENVEYKEQQIAKLFLAIFIFVNIRKRTWTLLNLHNNCSQALVFRLQINDAYSKCFFEEQPFVEIEE